MSIQPNQKVHTILIVDDTQIVRYSLKRILKNKAYQIYEANNATEMFELLSKIEPDTILLDAMMPGMTGFDACRICKADDNWKHIPIIMVTSLSQSEYVQHSLDAGADDFIKKPVNALELRARVRSALRIKQQFDELQQLLQIREQMASILVHDMRTPLSSIVLNVDIANHFVKNPRIIKALNTIRSQSERLQSLTTDMLMTAQLDEGHVQLDCQPINPFTLATEALARFADLANKHDITLQVDGEENSAEINADQRLMERVFDNLLSNALKYSPAGSTVTIRLFQGQCANAPHLYIDVTDEGPGILPAERELIFDRFGIGSIGSKRGDRFGLGLPFCRLVVEAHGGALTVCDNIPTGARFRMRLPTRYDAASSS